MGLFKQKKSDKKSDVESVVIDEEFREELREQVRSQFEGVVGESVKHLKQDIDLTVSQIGAELREYMIKQLDSAVAHMNDQISKQLKSRMMDYDRVTEDAHDLAVQSLNRSANALHEQYEQFNSALQKSIAGQEAMMIATYDENRARINEVDEIQEKTLKSLERSIADSEKQRAKLAESLDRSIAEQDAMLSNATENAKSRIETTWQTQDAAIKQLNDSVAALEKQHEELSVHLKESLASQEKLLITAFKDNMAYVIEHYLLDALGDQYDMKAQLPMIMKQMEDNQKAMVDDIKL